MRVIFLSFFFQDNDDRINPLATLNSEDTQSIASSENTGDAPIIIVRGKGSFLPSDCCTPACSGGLWW